MDASPGTFGLNIRCYLATYLPGTLAGGQVVGGSVSMVMTHHYSLNDETGGGDNSRWSPGNLWKYWKGRERREREREGERGGREKRGKRRTEIDRGREERNEERKGRGRGDI